MYLVTQHYDFLSENLFLMPYVSPLLPGSLDGHDGVTNYEIHEALIHSNDYIRIK